MSVSQRDTLALLKSALRSEAHVLRQWPHLLGQQLHHACARRTAGAAPVAAMLERHLEGRRWIRATTRFGRPVAAGQWSLGRGRDILAIRFTRDCRHAVALSPSACAVWVTASGEPVSEFSFASPGQASALAVAADGKTIAVGHKNGYCSLWDLAEGSCRFEWQAHDEPIEAVALTDDPRRVATLAGTSLRKALRIWEPPSNQAVREHVIEDTKIAGSMAGRLARTGPVTIRDPGRAVMCAGLDFLEPGEAVLYAQPGAARVWNWARDDIVWRTERDLRWWAGGGVSFDEGIVAAQALAGAGEFIVVSDHGAVQRPGAPEAGLPALGSVQRAVFSAAATVYLASNARGDCRMGWRSSDGWREQEVDFGRSAAFDLSADGRLAVAAVEDRCTLFDVSELTGRSAAPGLDGHVSGAVFTMDGGACTLSGYSELVHLEMASTAPLWRATCAEGALTGLARSAHAPIVAASSRNGVVLIVDGGSPGASKTMPAAGEELTCIAVSADAHIAAGCGSGAVLIWESAAGDTYRSIQVFDEAITALAWLSATELAVAAEARDVRIVDVRRPRRHVPLRAHEAWVTCLAGCAGHGLLVSGGMDGRICLWEPGRSTEPRTAWRDRIEPAAVAWLPKDGLLASVDARGMLRLRSESGAEIGLCPLEGPPVALQCLDGSRAGYVNRSGEITVLEFHGISAKE